MHNFFQPPENVGRFGAYLCIGFIIGCNAGLRQGINVRDVTLPFMFIYAMLRTAGTMEQRINQATATALGMAIGFAISTTTVNVFEMGTEATNAPSSASYKR
jgi:hypothetical protein